MGWSCSTAASATLKVIEDACRKQPQQSSNSWTDPNTNKSYFFEVSRKEHADGAITGTVMKMLEDGTARKAGYFKIAGEGHLVDGPAWFFNTIEAHGRAGLKALQAAVRREM